MPTRFLPQRIHAASACALLDVAATRRLEAAAAAQLPAHTLMQRAGLAVARLALALAPHARTIWVACGPGNNGGDGLEAALHLHRWLHTAGVRIVLTWLAEPATHATPSASSTDPFPDMCTDAPANIPADAWASWQRVRQAGLVLSQQPPQELCEQDLCIDALLGLGSARPPSGTMAQWLHHMHRSPATILAVDLPTGLDADSGRYDPGVAAPSHIGPDILPGHPGRRHTLTLLCAKPGLFTAQGRDACGTLWLDTLGLDLPTELHPSKGKDCAATVPTAWLNPAPVSGVRAHDSHKGSFGDVAVIGGESQPLLGSHMAGAALLAASAALHAAAGRVYLCPLGEAVTGAALLALEPELMLRDPHTLSLAALVTVCGCGGGKTVAGVLPRVLRDASRLVLDADALNAIARSPALQHALRQRQQRTDFATVLTPHPLEAARLLQGLAPSGAPGGDGAPAVTVADVQRHRLHAAQKLADGLGTVVVLKGSGSIIAAPGRVPRINPTGNARLAVPGSGDVLAGLLGARLAQGLDAFTAASVAVWQHGHVADLWRDTAPTLTALELARTLPMG